MAGSRAASAREPGQIREEAALSVTARAPRISLAGADDRRARPGTSFKGGCTVRFPMTDIVRQLVERWNAGDVEGSLELYTDDAVMLSGPDWPEQVTWRGHEGIRANMIEWISVWESSEVEIGSLVTHGDRIAGKGVWTTRGRASGAGGQLPFAVVLTVRGGRIAVLEWFTDYDAALAAARGDA
jgi:ketosteroid isomerase-like protein